jgi:transcriptional regulator with XRE-family HTH domain
MPKRSQPLDTEFAQRIKELMASKGIKNSGHFHKIIGVSKRTIDEWIKGRIPTYRTDLRKLCDLFEVDLDYLIFGKTSKPSKVIQINFTPSKPDGIQAERRVEIRREEDKLLRSLVISLLSKPTE